ncbi:MAG TPA: RDD family protein [Burkholderiaceae bacterium]|jgi:uncharacterized RDD family membrane protein YckC
MSEAVDPRFAPPVAHVEDVAAEQGGEAELASRWMRYWGVTVDGIVTGGIFLILKQLPSIGSLVNGADGDPAAYWALHPAAFLISSVLFLLINGWPLLTRGQTLGKMVCGTRIVRMDGSRVDAGRLLLRQGLTLLTKLLTGVSLLYSLIDSLMIYRSSRRCLHDTIADTKVIKL